MFVECIQINCYDFRKSVNDTESFLKLYDLFSFLLTDGETNEIIYIYILITGMIAITIGICVLCRKHTTAILYGLKKKRKTSPHNNYQLQVIEIENSQREESSHYIMDENKLPSSTEDDNYVYDYGW